MKSLHFLFNDEHEDFPSKNRNRTGRSTLSILFCAVFEVLNSKKGKREKERKKRHTDLKKTNIGLICLFTLILQIIFLKAIEISEFSKVA